MTGIVVVSHSRALAAAAVDLAMEMVHGEDVRIAVAAGLDETTFGTDATAIVEAIGHADDGSGVVVLMDLGSAVLSAELALDLLDPRLRERVVLCPAPLVEGLVVATVAAAGGAGAAEVAQEAMAALSPKAGLAPEPETRLDRGDVETIGPEARAVVTVRNRHGLHARPAARLVQSARATGATVEVADLTNGGGPVPATSLTRLAALGVLHGHRIEICARGPEAQRAVDVLVALADRDFDEAPSPDADEALLTGASVSGPLAASPGIAVGPIVRLEAPDVVVPDEPSTGADAEWRRMSDAVASVRADVLTARDETAGVAGEDAAGIFDAHLLLLDDDELLAAVRRRVEAGAAAPAAWSEAASDAAASLAALTDGYLRERAADVESLRRQVLARLVGAPKSTLSGEGILVAHDLAPADVAGVDASAVRAIVTAGGSPTGHAAILARARGIPAIVAAGPEVLSLPRGTLLAVDGGTGDLVIDPADDVIARWEDRAAQERARTQSALALARRKAVTGDGTRVAVGANLGSVQDAEASWRCGADLAGLVRTEFLFLDRSEPPGVDEQVDTYLSLARALGGRRLTVRTLDVGGDKPLRYAPQRPEANPFLGVRGIRLALREGRLLRDQLAAVVEAAHQTPISVMFPMVSAVSELVEVRRRLDRAVDESGRGWPGGLEVGVMVEVPSAALTAGALAPLVDFFSIGTNDLTQYTLAAERGNPDVATLADPLDPAVLTLIDAVCRAAAGRVQVGVCGELAADERAVPLLVALGVRELSVAPPSIPTVKEAVRAVERADDVDLVKRCLAASSASEVRGLLA